MRKNVVKMLRDDDLWELPDSGIDKKGIKVKATPEMARMVKDHLTRSRTATISSAKRHLEEAGILWERLLFGG